MSRQSGSRRRRKDSGTAWTKRYKRPSERARVKRTRLVFVPIWSERRALELDLHEATQKLQSSGQQNARGGEDLIAAKKHLEEEKKKIEDHRKQVDEQRKILENKRKEVEEKEKTLAEFDRQLKKRKEQMDQLEASLKKAGGGAAAAGELNKKLTETQKTLEANQQQLEKAKEESQRSAAEMERLLQLVQMSQEEQNSKEKTIMDLQQALKNAQTKLRNQQQATAHAEEQRKKDEEHMHNDDHPRRAGEQVDDNRMAELEQEISNMEHFLEGALRVCGLTAESETSDEKGRYLYIEENVAKLEKYLREKCQEKSIESNDPDCSKENIRVSIEELRRELDLRDAKITELQYEAQILDKALRDSSNVAVLEDLKLLNAQKDVRIIDLERQIKSVANNTECLKDIEETIGALKQELIDKEESIQSLREQMEEKLVYQHDAASLDELEGLLEIVREREDRILELEDALRESVSIAAEREVVLENEERKRNKVLEKVSKLEQRLLSLQNAHAMRCTSCKPMLQRVQFLENRLEEFLRERRSQLKDLAQMKQEALESAISEKDAHLALLEVSGIRTENQADRAESLRRDRKRLTDRLKKESERVVANLQECTELEMEFGLFREQSTMIAPQIDNGSFTD